MAPAEQDVREALRARSRAPRRAEPERSAARHLARERLGRGGRAPSLRGVSGKGPQGVARERLGRGGRSPSSRGVSGKGPQGVARECLGRGGRAPSSRDISGNGPQGVARERLGRGGRAPSSRDISGKKRSVWRGSAWVEEAEHRRRATSVRTDHTVSRSRRWLLRSRTSPGAPRTTPSSSTCGAGAISRPASGAGAPG